MFDNNLMLRTDAEAALTVDELTRASVDFGAGDVRPLTYILIIPSVSGTTPTLDAEVEDSANGSTWRNFLTYPQITAVGLYARTGVSPVRYRRGAYDVGGTTPNFGTTRHGPDVGGEYDRY